MTYRAPVADIAFTLNHIAGLSGIVGRGLFEDLDTDTVNAILEEAGRFATEEIAPTNRASDTQGARLVNGEVVMPDGVTEAYRKWVKAGWGSVAVPPCRAGLAVRALHGAHRDVERRQHGVRAQSAADAGGRARHRGSRLGGAATEVSAEARDRRVDRLHAAHRTAGGLRSALHENPRGAG